MSESEAILDLEPRPDPYVGKVLAGRYKMLRVIGSGGMGAVYEAEHALIGRRVAVKILYSQLAGDAQVVKRFVNEARAAATIGHPHILECTDIGQADDGSPFLVLELLEGHDLEKDFEDNGPMRIGRFVRLVRMACSALVAAHEKGIVHRDIKPENIFLSVQKGVPDHVKVLDFGISKFNSLKSTGPGTMSGSAMGTPYYMSPEQFRDASNVDARADVYAMGVILFQGFAGRLPYMADNLPGLALEIATGNPPPLEEIRPDLPVELVEIVKKSMARDAAVRFQSMRELDAALAPFEGIDAPVDVRHVDHQSVAHMPTAAALNMAGKHSQIRVKNDGITGKSFSTPIAAAGVALAVLGGGAGIYAMTRPHHSPPAPVAISAAAAPAPTPTPAPLPTTAAAPAPAAKFAVSIAANADGATANLRGRTVALPFTEELEAGSSPELIEVTAPNRTSMRFAFTIDRPRSLFASLERGRGVAMASDSQLAMALSGQSGSTGSERGSSHGSTTTTTTTAAAAETPRPDPRPRNSGSVYTGPSGNLPDL